MSINQKSMDNIQERFKGKFPQVWAQFKGQHPEHLTFGLINEDVKVNGTPWKKCNDCGQPYVVGEGTSNGEFCNNACEEKYLEYLSSTAW